MRKRILTLLLAVCMTITSMPMHVFAEEVQDTDNIVEMETSVEDEVVEEIVTDEVETIPEEVIVDEVVEEETISKEAKNEVISEEGVEINEENFPDDVFRAKVDQYDYDYNDILSEWEKSLIKNLTLFREGVTSLKGIEYLTELKSINCEWNELTTLDVSKLTKLESLYCCENQLTEIIGLNEISNLTTLSCYENKLTSLDVSTLPNLSKLQCYENNLTEIVGIEDATNLTELVCYNNELASLDVSEMTNLKKLLVENNKIAGILDLSKLTALSEIDLDYNYLDGIILPQGISSVKVYATHNHMKKESDVVNRTNRTYTEPQGNGSVEVNEENFPDPIFREEVSYCDKNNDDVVTTEELRSSQGGCWDFSFKELESLKGIELINEIYRVNELNCSNTKVSGTLELSGFYELEIVDFSNTEITSIDGLEDCEKLNSITCMNCNLEGQLDVSMLSKLNTLYVQNNYLEKIIFAEGQTVKNWKASYNRMYTTDDLVNFVVSNTGNFYPQGNGTVEVNEVNFPDEIFRNHVASFDDDNDGILTTIELHNDRKREWDITDLGISSLKGIELLNEAYRIEGLYCSGNNLSGVLDVSELKALYELYCDGMELTEIKGLENCKELVSLRCQSNKLTDLDSLENCTKLRYIYCFDNKLTRLSGIGNWTKLEDLRCYDNKITNLNGIDTCTELKRLQCYNNRITGTLDLSAASNLTTLYAWNNFLTKVVVNSGADSQNVNVKYNLLADRSAIEYEDRDGDLEWLPQGNIEVAITEENFPDDAFRAWVASYDKNNDGVVNTRELDVDDYDEEGDELTLERTYDLDNLGIKDLAGIEFLNNICEVKKLYCSGNELSSLDVSTLTGMKSLACANNELEEITGLEYAKNLIYLNCGHNKLTALDISELTQLELLYINDNLFEGTLDISHIGNDLRLDCEENYLTKIIISKDVEYSELNLRYNIMESEDAVINVDEEDNYYTYPQINKKLALTEENIPDSALRAEIATRDENKDGVVTTKEAREYAEGDHELDVSGRGVKNLQGMQQFYDLYPFEFFDCSQNGITGVLDLSTMPKIKYFDCSENKITGVILSEETDYRYNDMNFRYNQMRSKADIKGASDDVKSYAYFWPQGEKVSVEINRTNFPDNVFREFVAEEYDYDNDNVLSAREIEGAWYLWEWNTGGIKDFTGIEHLRALREVALDDDDPIVENLDALPDSVESFNCSNCSLMELPRLSVGLTTLYCSGNNLTELPVLPEGLEYLDCGDNKLRNLPMLPDTIVTLECNDNLLTSLSDLPDDLETLDFSDNKIANIAAFPSKVKKVVGDQNELKTLPTLPDTLQVLQLRENQLTSLPKLPDSLLNLDVYKNQLTELPSLPKYLSELNLHYNQITELTNLPVYLKKLYAEHNQLEGVLDVSNLVMLETLQVYDNKITGVRLCEDAKYKSINLQKNHMNSLDDVTGDEGITWERNGFWFESQKNVCERIGHNYKAASGWGVTKATFDSDGYGWLECSRCYGGKQDVIAKVMTPTFAETEYVYTGKKITPSITVTDANGEKLVKGTDFTVSGGYGTSPGRYSATIKLKGNYSGSKTIYFVIQPKAPSKVTATLSKYNSVKLSWSKCSGVKGYVVYYKTAEDTEYKELTTTTKTSYTKSSLTSGTEYEFKVVPRFKNGTSTEEGVNFKEASCWTLRKVGAPAVEKISDTKVKVSWEEVEGADGYSITYKTGKTSKTTTATANEKEITVKQNATYTYTVKAYKKSGSSKIYAPTSSSTSYLLRYVGASDETTTEFVNESEVKFGWDKATGANAYNVFYKEQEADEFTHVTLTKELSCTVGVDAGKTYVFKVVPCYMSGDVIELEGKETEAFVYSLEKMNVPTVKRSTSTKVKVSWEAVDDKTGYQISQATSGTKTTIASTYKTQTGTSKTISAPKKKTRYYKVRAYKVEGTNTIYGVWSDVTDFKNK